MSTQHPRIGREVATRKEQRAMKLSALKRDRAVLIGVVRQAQSILNRSLLGRLKWALLAR